MMRSPVQRSCTRMKFKSKRATSFISRSVSCPRARQAAPKCACCARSQEPRRATRPRAFSEVHPLRAVGGCIHLEMNAYALIYVRHRS
eukprot:2995738-Rhodomonas_salina.4